MSIASATTPAVNESAGIPRSIVLDPGWFDSNQMKFEDWWKEIRLFLKSNRVNRTDDRITAILACLREGIAGIYAQKKLDELDKDNDTQDWDDFVKEIKTTFSDKSKALILHILENCLKILKILISILSFVDDKLFIAQNKSLSISNSLLFCSYNIVSILLKKFSLIIKYTKMEVFYFSRSNRIFNSSSLNLSILGSLILHPSKT